MFFLLVFQQRKGGTELSVEFVGAIAHDRQATALSWAVFCEGGDDHMTTGLNRAKDSLDVRMTILRRCEEVKYGAVMPDIVGVYRKSGICDVRLDPMHCA